MINKFLVKSVPDWAAAMAVGVYNSTSNASASDTLMGYEIGRYPITLKTYKTVSGSNQLMFKTSLPTMLAASITEIGLFPAVSDNKNNFIVADFSETSSGSSQWTASGSTSSLDLVSKSRAGLYNVLFNASNSYLSNSNIRFDMSNYTQNDFVKLLIQTPASLSSGTFRVSFGDSLGNIWSTASGTASGSISLTSSGYYIVSLPLTPAPATNFNYSVNSVSINFLTTSTGSLLFDSMKLTSGDIVYSQSALVSRTIFTPPIAKLSGQPMQLEYYVQVT